MLDQLSQEPGPTRDEACQDLYISIKISTLNLFNPTRYSSRFFHSYKIKDKRLSALLNSSLDEAGNFKSQLITLKNVFIHLLKEKLKGLLKFLKIK